MNGEKQLLVIDEPVEFEKSPVEVQSFKRTTERLRGMYRIYPKLKKKNRKMTTCNRLDLETLGFWPILSKKSPGHWNLPHP